jgi:hypothetical protein
MVLSFAPARLYFLLSRSLVFRVAFTFLSLFHTLPSTPATVKASIQIEINLTRTFNLPRVLSVAPIKGFSPTDFAAYCEMRKMLKAAFWVQPASLKGLAGSNGNVV